jgi:hypothetical protein
MKVTATSFCIRYMLESYNAQNKLKAVAGFTVLLALLKLYTIRRVSEMRYAGYQQHRVLGDCASCHVEVVWLPLARVLLYNRIRKFRRKQSVGPHALGACGGAAWSVSLVCRVQNRGNVGAANLK